MSERRTIIEKAAIITAPLVVVLGAAACSNSEGAIPVDLTVTSTTSIPEAQPAKTVANWNFSVNCPTNEVPTILAFDTSVTGPLEAAVTFACENSTGKHSNPDSVTLTEDTEREADRIKVAVEYPDEDPSITSANIGQYVHIGTDATGFTSARLFDAHIVGYQIADGELITEIAYG